MGSVCPNVLSIGRDYSAISPEAEAHARRQGWVDAEGRFDFADRLVDRDRDAISQGAARCARGGLLLSRKAGALTAQDMMAGLRDHGEAAAGDPAWTPACQSGRSICMHAGPGLRRSQTTGAMVAELRKDRAVIWVTGTAAPCLSIFKPVLFETGLPAHGPKPTDRCDDNSLWWRHEGLHRAALRDFANCSQRFEPVRDRLEATFSRRLAAAFAVKASPEALRALIAACWVEAQAVEQVFQAEMPKTRPDQNGFQRSWRRLNQVAAFK